MSGKLHAPQIGLDVGAAERPLTTHRAVSSFADGARQYRSRPFGRLVFALLLSGEFEKEWNLVCVDHELMGDCRDSGAAVPPDSVRSLTRR